MASFRSIQFDERGESSSFPAWNRDAETDVVIIPGQPSRTVVQVGAAGPRKLALPISCNQSRLEQLLGAVGQSGTLTTTYDSSTAVLTAVGDAKRFTRQDLFVCTLQFVRP